MWDIDVVTIDTDSQDEYKQKVKQYLEHGYELKSCSCGYYGIASDNCYPFWMAILVKE